MLEALEWCKRLLRARLASAETRRIKRIRACTELETLGEQIAAMPADEQRALQEVLQRYAQLRSYQQKANPNAWRQRASSVETSSSVQPGGCSCPL
jgi:uncharacterized membrane protein YccC